MCRKVQLSRVPWNALLCHYEFCYLFNFRSFTLAGTTLGNISGINDQHLDLRNRSPCILHTGPSLSNISHVSYFPRSVNLRVVHPQEKDSRNCAKTHQFGRQIRKYHTVRQSQIEHQNLRSNFLPKLRQQLQQ